MKSLLSTKLIRKSAYLPKKVILNKYEIIGDKLKAQMLQREREHSITSLPVRIRMGTQLEYKVTRTKYSKSTKIRR